MVVGPRMSETTARLVPAAAVIGESLRSALFAAWDGTRYDLDFLEAQLLDMADLNPVELQVRMFAFAGEGFFCRLFLPFSVWRLLILALKTRKSM